MKTTSLISLSIFGLGIVACTDESKNKEEGVPSIENQAQSAEISTKESTSPASSITQTKVRKNQPRVITEEEKRQALDYLNGKKIAPEQYGDELIHACAAGNTQTVNALINVGVNINEATGSFGRSYPLFIAIENYQSEVLEILINAGADLSIKDGTVLQYAVSHRNVYAGEHLHVECVRLLVEAGVDVNAHFPLYEAIKNGNKEITDILIKAGADVNSVDDTGKNYMLYTFAREGQLDNIKALLALGADVNNGALHGVCSVDETSMKLTRSMNLINNIKSASPAEIVTYLLNAGADVNSTDKDGKTPLHMAAGSNQVEIVRLLILAGADINKPDKFIMDTPLHIASSRGNYKVVKQLLAAGADAHIKNRLRRTPLEQCNGSEVDDLGCKIALKAAMADPSSEEFLQHYLYAAAENGYAERVKQLIASGAKVNKANMAGSLPLCGAAENGYESVVKILLDAGADVNKPDGLGKLPAEYAKDEACKNLILHATAN